MSTARTVVETSLHYNDVPIYLWLHFIRALKSNDREDNFRSELGFSCTSFLFLL